MEWVRTTFGELKAGEIYAFSDPATDDCDSLDFICWIRGKNDGLNQRDTVYRLVSPEREALEEIVAMTCDENDLDDLIATVRATFNIAKAALEVK